MQQTKEAIYQSIGQTIVDSIQEAWNTAEIKFEVIEEDAFVMECEYATGPENTRKFFKGGFAIKDLMLELRELMAKENSSAWRKAVYKMTASGQFDINFEY